MDSARQRETWMELDAGLERPLPGDAPEREDPGAAEASANLRRRSFLKLAAASASLAACQRLPVRQAMPYLIPPEEITPGVPVRYAGTCSACPAACGLIATVRDGRPVKLEGDPQHELSRGGLCALGQGDLRALYDAGRLQAPRVDGRPGTWAELDAFVTTGLERARAAGRPLYALAPSIVSPAARRALQAFAARHGAIVVEHDLDPERPSALLEAYEVLAGRAVAPALDIERADVLVGLGWDILGTGPEVVAHTAAYAARRRAAESGRPFQHVQAEGSLSLTGAAADERWLATAADRRHIAFALLRRVAAAAGPAAAAVVGALSGLPEPAALGGKVDGLAAKFLATPGRGLIVSGANDRGEQLAVALCNRLLGNEGSTLEMARPSLVMRGLDRALRELIAAVRSGSAGAVFVVGLDPVEQLPEGEAFGAALGKLPLTVAITDRPTATAEACRAVAASHHGLECWADAEVRPGTFSLSQPMVRALFDTRPPFENFVRWAGIGDADYRTWVRETWAAGPGAAAADHDAAWNRALASGGTTIVSATTAPVAAATAERVAEALRQAIARVDGAPAPPLEVDLISEVGVRDGRRAHVLWLRELPDPLTRVAWTPCVRVAPSRARQLGVRDGDVLKISVDGREVTLPARVLPGQHPDVLAVPVGYGRRDGGADPLRNACRLARFDGGRLSQRGLPATAVRTGAVDALALVQPQATTEGRDIVHRVGGYGGSVPAEPHDARKDLWDRGEKTSPQWHMVIDLDACTGCSACVVACQAENNIPVVGPDEMRRHRDMQWLRIDRYFAGDPADPEVLFEPMLCAQCGHAPCETVCPVAATVHSEDGLNQQVYNRCVGTRYCANNCPYKVRRFNWFDNEPKMGGPLERMVLNPDVVVRARGIMEKCTFCVQRIQLARLQARAEGQDAFAVRTACQESCPAQAIHFGDGQDPGGAVAALRAKPRAFQVLAELGVEPAVTYLARVRPGRGGRGEEA